MSANITAAPGPPAERVRDIRGRGRWQVDLWDLAEIAVAVAAFVVLCVVILRTATFLPEPDDYAYQGSIIAMTDGHFLSLSAAQAHALALQLQRYNRINEPPGVALAIPQWVRLANGRWISEKDPGFPFLAAIFQWLGIIRWDQLFYGALGCIGLFAGARRWLGRFGGAAAVGLYCSAGAAMLWGWRDYMPTFTDASLIAAGSGALLWAVLASEATVRRRTVVGLLGFFALEAATFTRYTDVVVLGCAVVAVLAAAWRRPGWLPGDALWWWLGSVAPFFAFVGGFDDLVYGGPLTTGYRPGEIQFGLSAIPLNLRYLPAHLLQAMPVLVLGLVAIVWMGGRLARAGVAGPARLDAGRDLAVGVSLFAAWIAVWGLYSAYTWTAVPFGTTLQLARFYVPVLGPIALLGAWLVTRVPWRESRPAVSGLVTVAVVGVMFAIGIGAFHSMLTGAPMHRAVRACPRPVPVRSGNGPGGPVTCRVNGKPPG